MYHTWIMIVPGYQFVSIMVLFFQAFVLVLGKRFICLGNLIDPWRNARLGLVQVSD